MKHLLFGLVLLLVAGLFSCEEEKNTPSDKDEPSPVLPLKITSFTFEDFDPVVVGEIDTLTHDIYASVPRGTDISRLTPTITYSDSASLSPPSGYPYNFTEPLNFTLTRGDTQLVYTVQVDMLQATDNKLLAVSFPDYYINKTITDHATTVSFRYGTPIDNIQLDMDVSEHATVSPASGSRVDLSSPLEVTVTAENGETAVYTITAEELPQETAVRAFWIPAPWHSEFLQSYEDIQEGVAMADELNFNTLFVGSWAQSKILYPSQTLADHSSYSTPEDALFWDYTGGSGDPLTDLVEVAHSKGLKVILWYEYGFMARWGSAPTPENDVILAEHPNWVGIGNDGNPSNYNGTDYYYNAYHPDVQQFMLDMVMEAVNNYDIDGIQGDDRMPAMPRNSGYDAYTDSVYRSEFGEAPPTDYNNWDWVRWRADILNDFWQRLYDEVKAAKPELLITVAPNPYPWAFDNLMQEWPAWVANNTVEMLSVQCYRSTMYSYRATIDEMIRHYNQNSDGDLSRVVPGLLVYGSNGLTDPDLLRQQMEYNREKGIMGESFFYDEPLRRASIQEVLKALYPGKALFPTWE